MATNRGFVPFRNLGGVMSPRAIRYKTLAHNLRQIRVGDAAIFCSAAAGTAVDRYDSVSTTASSPILGVVTGIYNKTGRPFTFAQPDAGPFIPVSTSGYVEVLTDPNQTYLINSEATLSAGCVGMYVTVTAGGPNTACGISGYFIKPGAGLNTGVLTNSANSRLFNSIYPLQIVDFPHFGINGVDAAEGDHPNQQVEVRIADHAFVAGGANLRGRAD